MILTVTLNPAFDHLLWLKDMKPGRLNRASTTQRMPGGKGVNVACALAVLGEEVISTGLLGGQASRGYEESIRKAGVSTSFVYTDQEVRTDFYVVEEGKNSQTMLIEDGSPVNQRYLNNFLSNFDRLLSVTEIVEIGGSLPRGVDANFVKEIIQRAESKKKKVILDLGEPILKGLLDISGLFIVKPDLREKKIIFGRDLGDPDVRMAVAKDLRAKGAEIVILNYSKLNYLVLGKGSAYEGGIECEECGILIGVQDGMLAGFIHGYLASGNIEEAFKYSLASGLATERSKVNYPTSKTQVEKLLSISKIRKVG